MGLRSWQSEFFCDLLDGGEQIGGKYSLSSEFLVPRLSSWEHFGSWNRIAGTDAQLPVAFLGGTWWNNSWDSARKAHWCSFRSPQTGLKVSRTTKNYMVAPLISEGTHQFKIVVMDVFPTVASFLASKPKIWENRNPTVTKDCPPGFFDLSSRHPESGCFQSLGEWNLSCHLYRCQLPQYEMDFFKLIDTIYSAL